MEPIGITKNLNNALILKLIIGPRFGIHRHVILILLLAAGFYTSRAVFQEPVNTYAKTGFFLMLLFTFYINMYWFVPKLLFKDNYLGYFLWVAFLYICIQLIAGFAKHLASSFMIDKLGRLDNDPNLFFFTFIFIILMGASAAVKLFQRWVADTQRINELENTTIQSELEHLKKQINPHFLFNTLNNVNVLTQKDPAKASQVIIKLSDLLRYQLYDSVRDSVFLSAELHFLEDFLNLEKIRRDEFDFSIRQQGRIAGVEVPPLLFITFIENAVKHNMDAEKPSYVYLSFEVDDKELNFHCINSKPRIKVVQHTNGGLGLTNVRRRMELLYPGCHNLSVTDNTDTFNIHLTIKL